MADGGEGWLVGVGLAGPGSGELVDVVNEVGAGYEWGKVVDGKGGG